MNLHVAQKNRHHPQVLRSRVSRDLHWDPIMTWGDAGSHRGFIPLDLEDFIRLDWMMEVMHILTIVIYSIYMCIYIYI